MSSFPKVTSKSRGYVFTGCFEFYSIFSDFRLKKSAMKSNRAATNWYDELFSSSAVIKLSIAWRKASIWNLSLAKRGVVADLGPMGCKRTFADLTRRDSYLQVLGKVYSASLYDSEAFLLDFTKYRKDFNQSTATLSVIVELCKYLLFQSNLSWISCQNTMYIGVSRQLIFSKRTQAWFLATLFVQCHLESRSMFL